MPIFHTRLDPLAHIPGDYGWPVIGYTFEGLRDPIPLLRRMHEKYGALVRGASFGLRFVVAFGPEATQQVLLDRTRSLSNKRGYDFFLGRLFSGGLMLRDFEEHQEHRAALQSAFTPRALKTYLAPMSELIGQAVSQWDGSSDFTMRDAMKSLSLRVSARVLFGIDLGPSTGQLARSLQALVDAIVSIARVNVPGTRTWQALRARRYLESFLLNAIAERRRNPGPDMLSLLCRPDESSVTLTDHEIVDHLVFMLVASHDTVTSAVTTMTYALARHPDWQQRVRNEVTGLGTGPLDYDALRTLPDTECVFREALRLYPPVPVYQRMTTRTCELAGYEVPANTLVHVAPTLTHRLPEWYRDPDAFDPARFSAERAEHRKHRFAWVPFGAGAHTCLGLQFATMEAKVVMRELLPRFELVDPSPRARRFRIHPFPLPYERPALQLRRRH